MVKTSLISYFRPSTIIISIATDRGLFVLISSTRSLTPHLLSRPHSLKLCSVHVHSVIHPTHCHLWSTLTLTHLNSIVFESQQWTQPKNIQTPLLGWRAFTTIRRTHESWSFKILEFLKRFCFCSAWGEEIYSFIKALEVGAWDLLRMLWIVFFKGMPIRS